MILNFIYSGVKIVAAKMVALDDAVGSESSDDEIHELYD